jgi:hypothetical protein
LHFLLFHNCSFLQIALLVAVAFTASHLYSLRIRDPVRPPVSFFIFSLG